MLYKHRALYTIKPLTVHEWRFDYVCAWGSAMIVLCTFSFSSLAFTRYPSTSLRRDSVISGATDSPSNRRRCRFSFSNWKYGIIPFNHRLTTRPSKSLWCLIMCDVTAEYISSQCDLYFSYLSFYMNRVQREIRELGFVIESIWLMDVWLRSRHLNRFTVDQN